MHKNPLLRAGFPRRAVGMTELCREGLRMGLRSGALTFEDGGIRGVVSRQPPVGELRELFRAADLIGRWFGLSDGPATPFVLLGVSP
jgi:hypothetical protein